MFCFSVNWFIDRLFMSLLSLNKVWATLNIPPDYSSVMENEIRNRKTRAEFALRNALVGYTGMIRVNWVIRWLLLQQYPEHMIIRAERASHLNFLRQNCVCRMYWLIFQCFITSLTDGAYVFGQKRKTFFSDDNIVLCTIKWEDIMTAWQRNQRPVSWCSRNSWTRTRSVKMTYFTFSSTEWTRGMKLGGDPIVQKPYCHHVLDVGYTADNLCWIFIKSRIRLFGTMHINICVGFRSKTAVFRFQTAHQQ